MQSETILLGRWALSLPLIDERRSAVFAREPAGKTRFGLSAYYTREGIGIPVLQACIIVSESSCGINIVRRGHELSIQRI